MYCDLNVASISSIGIDRAVLVAISLTSSGVMVFISIVTIEKVIVVM